MKQKSGWHLPWTLVVIIAVVLMTVAAMMARAETALTHHTRDAVANGKAIAVGRMPAEQVIQLDVVLPLSDQAGLDYFLQRLYDPESSSYRQFLTPQEFTALYGPTKEDYDAAVRYLEIHGLTIVGGDRDGMDIQVRGPVSTVESAFHVEMYNYRHPAENRIFFAPDREPSTDLPFALWHISGMDNYSIPRPKLVTKEDYAKAHGISPETAGTTSGTGSGPSGSYLGSDMRAAYYGGTTLTGAGQNLGLWEFEGTDLADVTTYYANIKQTNSVPITLYSVDGTKTTCVDSMAGGNCDDTEQTLDITQALGMAPGLASLVVYIGSTDTGILSKMTTHSPLPMTISCSWGWTPVDVAALDPYFQKMSAQGQNFFVASGDNSTWSAKNMAWPADDANVIAVGGTDLVTTKAGGAWKSETAWSDSGGGISPDRIPIPAWQKLWGVINSSNKGSTLYRNGPDVSANANFSFYVCSDQKACTANTYGGTSFAAPMWAAYMALVNQQLAKGGYRPLGFLNPYLYAENITLAGGIDFHDITSGISGSYSAVKGYDLVTGWGSPNGVNLINTLLTIKPAAPKFFSTPKRSTFSLNPDAEMIR